MRTGLVVVLTICVVMIVGTAGYMLIEGWGFLDALYMTVITIFTIGFSEVNPLSNAGVVFTILLILGGVGTILYAIGKMVEYVIGGQLSGAFRRRAVRKQVEGMKDHHIICGYGRVGEAVAHHLLAQGAAMVVVETEAAARARAAEAGLPVIGGRASSDDTLGQAGVARAKALIAAIDSDSENVFVTLSARVLNPNLLIVARAGSEATVKKLERAGADHVVTPYGIGGRRMAVLALEPRVGRGTDGLPCGEAPESEPEVSEPTARCITVARPVHVLSISRDTGATVLAVRRACVGRLDTNPSPETLLNSGDMIVAVGTPGEMRRLEEIVGVNSRAAGGQGE